MPACKTKDLFDLTKTIAAAVLEGTTWPWEALEGISVWIREAGPLLDTALYDNPAEGVWIAKTARVAPTASISGPCIIDEGAEVRHCAFIRGSAVVGKGAVVGNSVELKNAILFDEVQVPHFNYVGDSILGYKAHLGAGAVTSNVKSDKSLVVIKAGIEEIETGRKKVGALVGDFTEVGCNSVLCPGTVLGRSCTVYPTSCVRGMVAENHIFKAPGNVVAKR